MQWHIHALDNGLEDWVDHGVEFYIKRFRHPFEVNVFSYPLPKKKRLPSINTLEAESQILLQPLQKQDFVVCLDEHGSSFSSIELATKISQWHHNAHRICFLLGGPDGNHHDTKTRANMKLSLSRMTMPHGLARLVLIEQLYRAMTLMCHHPYHRP